MDQIFLAAFGALYLTAAYREERAFETSPFAEEYKNYRKSTVKDTVICFGAAGPRSTDER